LSELIQVKPGGKNGKGQDNNKIIFEILRLIENSQAMVKKQCVELLPQLIQYLPEFQNKESLFKQAIESILKFVKNREKKDGESTKGVGFIALGKISLLVSR
jgi:hypothetical protein